MILRDIERWQIKDTFAFCINISFDKNQIIYDHLQIMIIISSKLN